MDKKLVLANTIVALFGAFFAFIAIVWSLPEGIIMWLLALAPFLVVFYWRWKIFPISGFLLIRTLFAWTLISGVVGFMLTFALVYVSWKLWNVNMNHGAGPMFLSVGSLAGLFVGVIIGVKKYRRRVTMTHDTQPEAKPNN